jgi:predicted permease
MHALISLILFIIVLSLAFAMFRQVAHLVAWLGVKACVAAVLAVLAAVWLLGPSTQPTNSAAAYRDAQTAVERATGEPCDYACKVMIANMGRHADAPPQ